MTMVVYRAHPLSKLHWVHWRDEYVVFCETSGQTHHLDPLRAFVLNLLVSGSYEFDDIRSELGKVPALDTTPQLSELLNTILSEFRAHGLLEMSLP